MENQKGHPSHGRPSSSQDYRYPPPTTHHFPPGSSTSFHHAYTASLVAAGQLEQQQQTAAVLPQRDVITRLPPRIDNRGYQQADQLSVIPGNMDTLDQQRTDALKKQALASNPYFYHPNFAVTSSVAVDNIHSSLGTPKECPPNLVVGSAIAMDSNPPENSHMVHNMDMASSTSSPSTCTSLQPPNNPETTGDPSATLDLMTRKDSVTTVPVKEPSAAEAAELLRLKYAPKANSLIQTLLRKGGQPPDGLSYDQYTDDPNDVRVISTKAIEPGQVYGPLKGNVKTLDCLHNTQAWELCLDGMVAAYIAPTPRKEWMGYVRNARFPEECNLEAGQVYGRIYFTVVRRIEPGSELRVFFSDVYRENCGFMYDLPALNYNKDSDDFSCTMCNIRVNDSKSMIRHYKFTHQQSISRASSVKVRKRRHLLDGHPTLELDCSEEERSREFLDNEEGGGDEGEDVESDGSSSEGADWLEEEGRDQSLGDGGVSKRFICTTCGKTFHSHSQLLMHESFHKEEEGEEEDSDEDEEKDNRGDISEELTDEGDGIESQRSHTRSARSHNCEAKDQGAQNNTAEANDSNVRNGVKPLLQENRANNCLMCGFKTSDDALFVVHISSHGRFPLGCKKCGNTYKCKRSLRVHMLSKHTTVSDDESYPQPSSSSSMGASANNLEVNRDPCPHCRYYTPHKSVFAEHLEKHKKYPHGCWDCGNTYSGLNILYRHRREKHNDGYIRGPRLQKSVETVKLSDDLKVRGDTCTRCLFRSADQGFLADHIRLHVTHPFGCRNCGNVYRTKMHLQRHMKEKHTALSEEEGNARKPLEEPQTCPKCGFTCPNKNLFEEHRRKHKIAGYGCDICGEVFPEDKFVMLHKQENHVGLLLEGLKEEPIEIDGDEEDYLDSGFIEIDVTETMKERTGNSDEQNEDVGD